MVAWFGVDGGRAEVESGLKVEEDEGVEEKKSASIVWVAAEWSKEPAP